MAVKLNRKGFAFGKELVNEGRSVRGERDAWSEDQPSAEQENEFIRAHGIKAYAKWHLGIDTEHPRTPKGDTSFPSGISRECIVARCLPPRAARGNASTWTLNEQRHICTR